VATGFAGAIDDIGSIMVVVGKDWERDVVSIDKDVGLAVVTTVLLLD